MIYTYLKMIRCLAYLLMFGLSNVAIAQVWQATQGDIIEVTMRGDKTIQSLTCMDESWPIKKMADGLWHGWIGIDLQQASQTYPVIWQSLKTRNIDSLVVKKGNFRISRITVKKKMSDFDAKAVRRIRADQKAIRNTYKMTVDGMPDFEHAVAPVKGIESTPFGAQRYVNGQAKSPHSGVDIAAAKGTPIMAPLSGKVLLIEDMFLNGKLMAIGHGDGLVTVYAHLNQTHVLQGQWVQAGQHIADVGSTGRSTGPHLHWGMHFKHARVNPTSIVQSYRRK